MPEVTVAAVQATPVFLDRDATVEVVVSRTKDTAKLGAELIVFPETFIPTYPDWVWRSPAWDGGFDGLMDRLVDQSVAVPGPATAAIGKAAKAAEAYVSVGVNELGDSTAASFASTSFSRMACGATAQPTRRPGASVFEKDPSRSTGAAGSTTPIDAGGGAENHNSR